MSVKQATAIVGVSGSGKTTLANNLEAAGGYKLVCSHTTRPMRPGEVNGKDYFFVSKEEFDSVTRDQQWVEFIELYGHYYGLHVNEMRGIMANGLIPVIILDPFGFEQTAKYCRESEVELVSFYVDGATETLVSRYLQRLQESQFDPAYHALRISKIQQEKVEWLRLYNNIVNTHKLLGGIISSYGPETEDEVHTSIRAVMGSAKRQDYYSLQKEVVEWANTVFQSRNEETIVRKLAMEELPELVIALSNGDWDAAADEMGDVFILLMDLSHRLGIDILREASNKMVINRQRNWTINALGVSHHV